MSHPQASGYAPSAEVSTERHIVAYTNQFANIIYTCSSELHALFKTLLQLLLITIVQQRLNLFPSFWILISIKCLDLAKTKVDIELSRGVADTYSIKP